MQLWQDLFGSQGEPPDPVVLTTAVVALAVVVVSSLWRLARNVITIVHEAGHALVAVLVGRRLSGIRLHSDTSGLTLTKGKPYGPGMVCTSLAGYLAPALLGLAFAGLVGAERVTALLVVCAILLLGVLIMVRNAYGVFSVLASGAVLVGVSYFGSVDVQAVFAHLITWFLLLGGIRPVGELARKRRHGMAPYSDADQAARLTGTPGWFWVGAFGLINFGALVLAAGWLIG